MKSSLLLEPLRSTCRRQGEEKIKLLTFEKDLVFIDMTTARVTSIVPACQAGWEKMKNLRGNLRKGAGTFHSAGQSKEELVGFGTFQHLIFMKLLPDHLWY